MLFVCVFAIRCSSLSLKIAYHFGNSLQRTRKGDGNVFRTLNIVMYLVWSLFRSYTIALTIFRVINSLRFVSMYADVQSRLSAVFVRILLFHLPFHLFKWIIIIFFLAAQNLTIDCSDLCSKCFFLSITPISFDRLFSPVGSVSMHITRNVYVILISHICSALTISKKTHSISQTASVMNK